MKSAFSSNSAAVWQKLTKLTATKLSICELLLNNYLNFEKIITYLDCCTGQSNRNIKTNFIEISSKYRNKSSVNWNKIFSK